MSRSYKKIPMIKDANSRPGKSSANRKVRRAAVIANGGGYRKVYETWNICDYRHIETEEEFMAFWEKGGNGYIHRHCRTRKEAHRLWLKWYRNK